MNILIIGYGSIGTRHLATCQKLHPEHNYAVLRRKNSAPSANLDAKIFTDAQALENFSPDLSFICTPTAEHANSLRSIAPYLKNGTTVFFEKPYAHTLSDLEAIRKLVKEKDITVFYGCVLRYHPLLLAAKKLLASNSYGKILNYKISCLSYLPDWRPGQDYTKSYSSHKEMGGGVLMDLIHEFDYAEFLFGKIEKLEGKLGKISDLKIDSDDYCQAQASHKNAHGEILLSYNSKESVRTFEISMEKAKFTGNLLTGDLSIVAQGTAPETKSYALDRDSLFSAQAAFIFDQKNHNKSNIYYTESMDLNRKLIEFSQKALAP